MVPFVKTSLIASPVQGSVDCALKEAVLPMTVPVNGTLITGMLQFGSSKTLRLPLILLPFCVTVAYTLPEAGTLLLDQVPFQ
mgnify:CR=1 FL=1